MVMPIESVVCSVGEEFILILPPLGMICQGRGSLLSGRRVCFRWDPWALYADGEVVC